MALLGVGYASGAGKTAGTLGQFDASCNGGRGIQLHPPDISDLQNGYAVALRGGDVLFGFSYMPPTYRNQAPRIILEAVRSNCTIDPKFGVNGVLHLKWPGDYLGNVDAIAQSRDGGALIFGGSNEHLIATEIDSTGQPVRSFGRNGWLIRKLPDWSPEVASSPYTASLLQEPNGTILMGSDNGCSHGCTVPRVYAFSSAGQLRWTYAPNSTQTSRVLPMGSEVGQLIPLASGTIVIVAPLTFAGCGSLELAALNQRGRLEPAITSNLQRSVEKLRPNSYNGGTGYLDSAGGAGIFGYLQDPCDWVSGHSVFMANFLERTTPGGRLSHAPQYMNAGRGLIAADQFGLELSRGVLVVWHTNSTGGVVEIRGLEPNGTPVATFGRGGSASIRECNQASYAGGCFFSSMPMFAAGPRGDFDVIVPEPIGPKLLELTG